MELPIQQCRSSLQGCVDPLRTVGTERGVPRVGKTDERQTAVAGQHWTGIHRLSSLLIDLRFTTIQFYSIVGDATEEVSTAVVEVEAAAKDRRHGL